MFAGISSTGSHRVNTAPRAIERTKLMLQTSADVVAALSSSGAAFDAQRDLRCVLMPAKGYLSWLRAVAAEEHPEEEGDRVLIDAADGDIRVPEGGALANELANVLSTAFPGWQRRVILTKRAWLTIPEFHVDEAAATLVFPLENAPTHISCGRYQPLHQTGGAIYSKLHIRTRAASVGSDIHTTGLTEILMMKGLGWRAGDMPLVHSPPAMIEGTSQPRLKAAAIIVELERGL
jgi:hypothetical protein